MEQYQEYPKVLSHPGYMAPKLVSEAVPGVNGGNPRPAVYEPERYPPVTVKCRAQEEEYEAKGYVASGKCDATAYVSAAATPYVPRDFHEYPKWLTASDGAQALARSAEEEARLTAQWQEPAGKRKRA